MERHELNSRLKRVIGELKYLEDSDIEVDEDSDEELDEGDIEEIKDNIRDAIYKLEDNLS